MTSVFSTMRIDTPGLDAVRRSTAGGNLTGAAFDRMRRRWESRYQAFVSRRYDAFSRGAGDWPALSVSTIEQRRGAARGRRGKGGGSGTNSTPAGGFAVGSRMSLGRETRQRRVDKSLRRGKFGDPRGAFVAPLVSVGKRTIAILKDTGQLRKALDIGATGNKSDDLPAGIEFGFSGARHSDTASSAKTAKNLLSRVTKKTGKGGRTYAPKKTSAAKSQPPTYAQLATWHNDGTRHMPRRLILAQPNAQTIKGMGADLRAAILDTAKGAGK